MGKRKYSDIGYHWYIDRRGKVSKGRDEWRVGAHCPPRNKTSIAICLSGCTKFYTAQFKALDKLIAEIKERWPSIKGVYPHREFQARDCPVFNGDDYKAVTGKNLFTADKKKNWVLVKYDIIKGKGK